MSNAQHIPGSDLTRCQKAAAAELLAARPMCVPGTNAIISSAEARTWHEEVATVAAAQNVTPVQAEAFFDACGVAE